MHPVQLFRRLSRLQRSLLMLMAALACFPMAPGFTQPSQPSARPVVTLPPAPFGP